MVAKANPIRISESMVRVYVFMFGKKWATAVEISEATNVNPRTVRHHVKRLSEAGLFETLYTFPAHRYRRIVPEPKNVRRTKFYRTLAEALDAWHDANKKVEEVRA